jgi:hypothetical protein
VAVRGVKQRKKTLLRAGVKGASWSLPTSVPCVLVNQISTYQYCFYQFMLLSSSLFFFKIIYVIIYLVASIIL